MAGKPASARTVLIVEDEKPIRDLIVFALKRGGFEIAEAGDVRGARACIASTRPDLILLDWMLPDVSGIEMARQMKRDANTRDIPIIMLTARAAESDKVAGLDGGADDYIVKPFAPRELLSRINAVLRRASPAGANDIIDQSGLVLDVASERVTVGERTVSLGPTEYRLLAFFMKHAERVFSRAQLLDRVWGGDVYVEERTVDVHIRRLRIALQEFGFDRFVQTVRGSGYRFSTRSP